MASQGRYGDNRLLHVNDAELKGIASLAPNGLTRNPVTGLPEAFGLKEALPMVAAIAATAVMPAGAPIWASALAGGAASGVTTGAVTGDWERGLAAGIMGAGLGAAAGAAGAAGSEALAGEAANVGATGLTDMSASLGTAGLDTAATTGLTDMSAALGASTDGMAGALGTAGLDTAATTGVTDMSSALGTAGLDSTATTGLTDMSSELGTAGQPWYKGEWGQNTGQRMAAPFKEDSGFVGEVMKPTRAMPIAVGMGQLAEMDAADKWDAEMKKTGQEDDANRQEGYDRLAFALGKSGYPAPGYQNGGLVRMVDGGYTGKDFSGINQGALNAAIEAQLGLIDRDNPIAGYNKPYEPFRRLQPLERNYFNSMVPSFETGVTEFRDYVPQAPQQEYLAPGVHRNGRGQLVDKDGNLLDPWGSIIGRVDENNTVGGPGGVDPNTNLNNSIDIKLVGDETDGEEEEEEDAGSTGGGGHDYRRDKGGKNYLMASGGQVMVNSDMAGQIPIAAGGIANVPQNMPPQGVPQADNPTLPVAQPQAGGEPSEQDIQMLAMAVTGQAGENADKIIEMFVRKFGPEMFMEARDFILRMVGGQNAQTQGMIKGQGGGMDDQVMGTIGGNQPVAVSPGEYIVPADVVSGLGDGSSDAGAQELDRMMSDVRMARGGTTTQPPPFNARSVMPR
jgi:hypothetical protein